MITIKRRSLAALLACGLSASGVVASEFEGTQLTEVTASSGQPGYQAGYQLGIQLSHLVKQDPDIQLDDALTGFCQALAKTGHRTDNRGLCQAGSTTGITGFNRTRQIPNAGGNRALDDYATLNARREGVVVLPSTVQYEVLKNGDGKSPNEQDTVLVKYQASLADGRVFDTTYDEGKPIPLMLKDIAAPGLKEALMLMQEGDQWRVVIPPRMGFGKSGNNRLRRRVLIYEIELVSIDNARS